MNLTTPPPAKLSDLIELAVSDAGRLDRARYTPMWMTWHRPRPAEGNGGPAKCMVCLAGAVIAGTLGCPTSTEIDIMTHENADPTSITIPDKAWLNALWALDASREGDWLEAFRALHGAYPEGKLYDAIEALPAPVNVEFTDWKKLDAHLASLTVRAEQLRELGL